MNSFPKFLSFPEHGNLPGHSIVGKPVLEHHFNYAGLPVGIMLLIKQWIVLAALSWPALAASRLSEERIVFQTTFGDIEMAVYPEARVQFLVLTTDRE